MKPITSGPVVLGLMIAIGGGYLLQLAQPGAALQWLALWPPGPREWLDGPHGPWQLPGFAPWQLVSYMLLHGGPLHLALNLIGLWLFGRPVERVLGTARFTLYALACISGAALAQVAVTQFTGDVRATIGASGLVFGLLPAFALFFPQARVQLLFPPVNLRAPVFVVLYGMVEFLFGISDTLPGVAHFAHLGGLFVGLGLLLYWRRGALRPPPPPSPGHR